MTRRNFLFTILGIGAIAKAFKPEDKPVWESGGFRVPEELQPVIKQMIDSGNRYTCSVWFDTEAHAWQIQKWDRNNFNRKH